jgi:iron complex transport system substrate-binding protein
LAAVLVAGCAGGGGTKATTTSPAPSSGFPLTVTNCGEQVTLPTPPKRTVLLDRNAISLVAAVGAFDRVVARAGKMPDGLYDARITAALAAIPSIGAGENAQGTVQISQEEVIAQRPDLVIAYETDTIKRAALAAAGIPMLIEPAFCTDKSEIPGNPSLDDVYARVEFWGQVFEKQDAAAASIADLRRRVAAVRAKAAAGPTRTGATLFVSVGGGPVYAYGRKSLSDPEMAAAGITNVFGDVNDRVFEVTPEKLVALNPEVLVLLYSDGDPAAIQASLEALPGVASIAAVRNHNVLSLLFGFTDPPTPVSVDGLERIVARFGPP